MKKHHILFFSIFFSFWAYGAIVRIQNNAKGPIEAGIRYGKKGQPGEKSKSEIIEPGRSALFNSWIEEIHTIYWKEDHNKWKVDINIPAFNIERKIIVYENGHFDGTKMGENLTAKELKKRKIKPVVIETPKVIDTPKEEENPLKKADKKHAKTNKEKEKSSLTYQEYIALKHKKNKKVAFNNNNDDASLLSKEDKKRKHYSSKNNLDDGYDIEQEIKRQRHRLEQTQEMEAENEAADESWGE